MRETQKSIKNRLCKSKFCRYGIDPHFRGSLLGDTAMTTNPSLIAARSASQSEFRNSHVRLGFELETHSVNSLSYHSLNSQTRSVTKTRTTLAQSANVYAADVHDGVRYSISKTKETTLKKIHKLILSERLLTQDPPIKIPCQNDAFRPLTDFVHTYTRRGHTGFYFRQCENAHSGLLGVLKFTLAQTQNSQAKIKLTRLIGQYIAADHFIVPSLSAAPRPETLTEEYQDQEPINMMDYLRSLSFSDETLSLDWKPDGSVRGPEITTQGPQTWTEVTERAISLFTDLDRVGFSVNSGCSFHIHASIHGVTPKYSVNFQSFLMRFVLNDPRVPVSVRQRWRSDALSQYFNFSLDTNKYRFVAMRSNTWEFRCFGNIDNITDALACLAIASDAYHAAINNTETLMLPMGMRFDAIALHAAKNSLTFDQALAALTTQDQADAA